MSKRTRVNLDSQDVDVRFASKVKMLVDFIAPKDLYLVAGRATAKTSDIVAERSKTIIYDMPRSYQLFVSDTYQNALTNVLPALIEGWERKGWRDGIHFVTDERPMYGKNFKMPYKPPLKYKHTISLFNGTFFNLGSLDQASGLAGSSYQHRYGDEARLLKKKKLDRSSPALRGEYASFGHSVYYMGNTFTTDMPNLILGDDDWILNMEKEMDLEQIELALQAAFVLNDIKREMISNEQMGIVTERERLQKAMRIWNEIWVRARKDSTFYYAVSSLVNLDILTDGYFKAVLKALGPEEFKTAILSFKVQVSQGEKFYFNLGSEHFFDDGVDNTYYDRFKIKDQIYGSSEALRYVDTNQRLEAGVDFGDMCSMIVGQERGNYLYILKEFYTLAPQNEEQLGEHFREFFRNHKYKVLDLYYDRSGNQNSKTKRDWASAIKRAIENYAGSSTGWVVNLISRHQGTIMQEEEYYFAGKLLSGQVSNLPKVMIDRFQCKCLKSSLELTKTIVKTNRVGSRTIHKDKSSEKLPLESRPMFSTNFSDAFKYFIYRRHWVNKVSGSGLYLGMEPGVV
jgi:hypothetical protein